MRGQTSPSPIYEGEDSVLAYMLDGPDASYHIQLPAAGEPCRAILESYTKEHSAEYQSQALIDLAFRMRNALREHEEIDWDVVESIVIDTSHHTHYVIGSGANDPQKYSPDASRETLDHSIMYIFAVALQDGVWHHLDSYQPARAARPDTVRLWRKITTREDSEWTQRYHHPDPRQKAFGGRVTIRLVDGREICDELAIADAHPNGARPFARKDYRHKLFQLANTRVKETELERFISLCAGLRSLTPDGVGNLNLAADTNWLRTLPALPTGLFFHGDRCMIAPPASPSARRTALRTALAENRLLRFPGAFSPLTALLIQQYPFDGIYLSGAVASANLGLPDIGLTSMTEVADFAAAIDRVSHLPTLLDIDTGFGEPVNVARSVRAMEAIGVSALHLEDQTLPKRCGHLDHKELITANDMARKIRAAIDARSDPNLLIVARTDARGVEGLASTIERARAYVDAGADAIFPEALTSELEFAALRAAVTVPLIANMTEFGKSPLLSTDQLSNLGFNIVIYPVTTLRWAMQAVEEGLAGLHAAGSQATQVDRMQTRQRLYEILQYDAYARWDARIVNFRQAGNTTL